MSAVATTTYVGRVKRALAFKGEILWGCWGRSVTPWPVETNPPSPAPGDTDIMEALVFTKPTVQCLVRPVTQLEWEALEADERAPVPVNGMYYGYVEDADAYSELARWVYVRFMADPNSGHPTGTFRVFGIFSDLVPAAGYEAAEFLLPAQVTARGLLEWLDNNPPVVLTTSYRHTCHIVIEFR